MGSRGVAEGGGSCRRGKVPLGFGGDGLGEKVSDLFIVLYYYVVLSTETSIVTSPVDLWYLQST